MGFFDRLLSSYREKEERAKLLNTYYKVINTYSPAFRTFSGGVYEMELTRAAIHTFASHVSKASPIIKGEKYKKLKWVLSTKPNDIMTASQFLYKIATIYEAENNCFIIPIYEDRSAGKIVGFYPARSIDTQIKRIEGGKLMLMYKVYGTDQTNGETYAIPYEEVGHLRKHFYKMDFYGENNSPMTATMNLMSTTQQAIINSAEQSATIRFIAKLANMLKPDDLKAEQSRLRETNLSVDNNGGIFMYDAKYSDVKQVDSKPFTVDAEQMKLINENVFNYFGTNESILQAKSTEQIGESYYESKLEPFLLELSQVITNMLFNQKDIEQGSELIYETSRLQFASTKTKMDLWKDGFDRGLFTHNEGRMIFNMSPIPDGNKHYIRLDYAKVNDVDKNGVSNKEIVHVEQEESENEND